MSALRWKLDPRAKGLRAVCAGPRGSTLRDADGVRYATVSHLYSQCAGGWFWVAGWGSSVPHKNTCNEPVATADQAKAAAMAYVQQHLAAEGRTP